MNPTDLLAQVPAAALWIAAGVAAAALALYGLWRLKRLAAAHPAEESLTVAVAAIATGVSAQGMWKFAGDVLGFDGPLRVLLFAFIELAVIASAVRARRSMRDNHSAGIDGVAVWVLTCLTAVLSAMDARSLAEAIFRLAAPLVAAWLWERGMAVERRRITGLAGINWRLTPERVLVRLGLAEARDRTASEVDAHRRLTRVALAAKRVHQLSEVGASPRRLRAAVAKRDRALDLAVEHTELARDRARQAALLDLVTTLGGGDSLTGVLATAAAPWSDLDHPAITGTVRDSEAVALAAELKRYTQARLGAPVAEAVATGDQSATDPATGRGPVEPSAVEADHLPPPSDEGRSWLASLAPWTRPEPRPVADLPGDHAERPAPVAEAVAEAVAEEEVDATDPRPVADRERPTEQDRRRAIRFYVGRAKKLNPPSKRTLAEWTGFSETWALGCIQEGRQQMAEQGWTFDDRGTPTPPAAVAEAVATTPGSATVPATVNGNAPAGGAA